MTENNDSQLVSVQKLAQSDFSFDSRELADQLHNVSKPNS